MVSKLGNPTGGHMMSLLGRESPSKKTNTNGEQKNKLYY